MIGPQLFGYSGNLVGNVADKLKWAGVVFPKHPRTGKRGGSCELAHMTRRHPRSHLRPQPWPTRGAARSAIFAFVEAWYSPRRRHSTLGYLSPAAYEEVHRPRAVA